MIHSPRCSLYTKVTELSLILDSAFYFNAQRYVDGVFVSDDMELIKPLLDYLQESPSIVYSQVCTEVITDYPGRTVQAGQ